MQYFLTEPQLKRMEKGLRVAISIPFIDDIEDYIVESILEYTKEIDGIDPFANIRSKRLYDVVDAKEKIGYSVKSLKWAFQAGTESIDKKKFAFFEEDIKLYQRDEITWRWTDHTKTGLQGIRRKDQMCVYRWYPNQKQFFERFKLPANIQKLEINPVRLEKAQVVDTLLPYLEEHP